MPEAVHIEQERAAVTRILTLIAVVALVAAACAAPGDAAPVARISTSVVPAPAASGDADRTVPVLMAEFSFDIDPIEITPGETVEFIVTNTGVVDHEFRVTSTGSIEDHLESGHDDHDGDEPSGDPSPGTDVVLLVAPGDTASIVVAFPEDVDQFDEVACLLPGHYEAGMSASIEYTQENEQRNEP
jgi:uncharacterized cupredoxin-like copper-binding protein